MKVLTRKYVPVKKSDFFTDDYGTLYVSLDFLRSTARQLDDPEPEPEELSGSGKLEPEPETMPAGLAFTFDDEKQTVTYGGKVLTFRGSIQYRILKMASSGKELNNRDVWQDIWGDALTEWRTILDAAKQVNLKLDRENIPYKITVNSAFTKLSEKI